MDMERELAKLRYHVRKLAGAISYNKHPIEHLVVMMDWSAEDLDDAFDIFQRYRSDLDNHGSMLASQLERDLCQRFDISYQTVKDIVLAFWRHHNYSDVCEEYARQNRVSEFEEILNSSMTVDYEEA
jgi:hypothetical protein